MTESNLPITGGCACGTVRYQSSAQPMMSGVCHCRQCQLSSGAGSLANLMFAKEALQVDGEVAFREYVADSGNKVRHSFCGECGSPLFGKSEGMPGVAVRAGSLDDPSLFQPQFHVYAANALPWDGVPDGVHAFEGMPPITA